MSYRHPATWYNATVAPEHCMLDAGFGGLPGVYLTPVIGKCGVTNLAYM